MSEFNSAQMSDKELYAIGYGLKTGKHGIGTVEDRILGRVAREILRGRRLVAEGNADDERAMITLRYIEEG